MFDRIKRTLGLSGDEPEFVGPVLYVNGKETGFRALNESGYSSDIGMWTAFSDGNCTIRWSYNNFEDLKCDGRSIHIECQDGYVLKEVFKL